MQTLPLTLTYTNTSTHTSTYTHTYTYHGIERKQAGKGFWLLAWQNSEEKKKVCGISGGMYPFLYVDRNICKQMLADVRKCGPFNRATSPHCGETTAWTTTYLPGRVVVAWPGTRHHINLGEWLMMQTIESQVCQYCHGKVYLGQAEEPMMPTACGPCVQIGLVCDRCGFVGQASPKEIFTNGAN